MQMKWVRRDKHSKHLEWIFTFVDVEILTWINVEVGDVVYIPGDIVDGNPTTMYGRHRVVDPKKQILSNGKKEFYENSSFVYKDMEEKMTVDEVAKQKGLDVFDIALPISWVKIIQKRSTINPVGNIVWCYKWGDWESSWGIPIAITKEGEILLGNLSMGLD